MKGWGTVRRIYLLFLILFIIIGTLVSCETDEREKEEPKVTDSNTEIMELPPRGTECTVQLKRDVLGQSGSLPTSPSVDAINGAKVQVMGRFVKMYKDWMIIEKNNEEIWIYKPNILLIEFER